MHHFDEIYPFSAIVGQEQMKKALILNAINPKIGGVLIKGEKGTAKSTAARALAHLLPDRLVVEGCTFGCDPVDKKAMCLDCQKKFPALKTNSAKCGWSNCPSARPRTRSWAASTLNMR